MLRLGVASRVLPADEVLPAAWEYAREIAVTTAPMSVAFSKRVLWASFDLDRDDVNHLETVLHHHLMGSPDAKEGVMAFLERRAPQWQGSVADDWPEVARRGTGMSFETTTDEVLDGVDLRGKIAVVTGASTGLGLETARALASVGAQVVLAGRDSARIDAAAATDPRTEPDAMLEQARLDLASLDSVRAFAEWYGDHHDRLHLLINNAGVMYTPFEHTAEGFEMQFGTNHVGHFLLTGPARAACCSPIRRRASSTSARAGTGAPTSCGTTSTSNGASTTSSPRTGSRRPPTSSSRWSSTAGSPTAACTRTRCTPG